MISLYDQAITNKIKNWVDSTSTTVLNPNENILEILSDNKNDRPIQFPVISIARQNSIGIVNPNRQPISYDGHVTEQTFHKTLEVNTIPIQLNYAINIITRNFVEADSYARELLFNLINFPTLEILLPYHDKQYTHQSTIIMGGSIDNNSQSNGVLLSRNLTVLTLQCSIQDAYLFDVRYRDNFKIVGDVISF